MNKKQLTPTAFALLGLVIFLLTACSPVSSTTTQEIASPVIETTPIETESPQTGSDEQNLRPIPVQDITVQIGVGSPIPVDVFVSGSWPDLCAQLASIDQRFEGTRVEISLLASPAKANCPPDNVGLPFRIAVPLNMVEKEIGTYNVVVNSIETTFEWNPQAGEASDDPTEVANDPTARIAYIAADGNVWVLNRASGETRQITPDATPDSPGGVQQDNTITYLSPEISSDGTFVAYRRDAGTPVEWGMQYQFSLWVYNLETNESRQITDQYPVGLAWKPGTHLLAYGLPVNDNYFNFRGEKPNADLATGIRVVDADGGEPFELVKPERGYSLVGPEWSPDGRFVSFDEVLYMEGRGPFAYYDTTNQEYIAWDDAIGNYSWYLDGSQIAYDRLTYVANGEERIFLKEMPNGEESLFTDEIEQDYAFLPVFSPGGDRIAFLAGTVNLDDNIYTLIVQDLVGGTSMQLGEFESVMGLSWSPDGQYLILSSGPYNAQQVYEVSPVDGSSRVLAEGSDPSVTTP